MRPLVSDSGNIIAADAEIVSDSGNIISADAEMCDVFNECFSSMFTQEEKNVHRQLRVRTEQF